MFKVSNNNNNNASYSRNNYFLNKNKNNNNKPESRFQLKEEMFPELNKTKDTHQSTLNTKNNFSTLFKNKDMEDMQEKDIDMDSVIENDGWITLKKSIPYSTTIIPKSKSISIPIPKKEEELVDPRIVFEKLTKIYEKWKKNYIELWGYDDYEKYYRFPNYDYSHLELELESDSGSEVIEEEEE